jgi:hypothetical protein
MSGTDTGVCDPVMPLGTVALTETVDAYVIEASTGIAGVRNKKNAPNPTNGIHTQAVTIRPQPNHVPVLTK